jgi:malonyl-CoA/methylmalonyl-CoA synthetase
VVTLTQTWAAHWKADPARVALVDASDGTAWTAAQLDLRSSVFAAHLASRGVAPGDRVLLSCAPSAETVAAYVGILRLGAVVVPANTGYTRAELDHIVSDVQPVLAVLDGDGDGDVDGDPSGAAAPPPAVDGRVPRLPLEPLSPSHTRATPSGIDAVARVAPRLDASADDDLAMIAFTSGTTGRPKGAMLTQGNLRAGAEALVTAWEWTADDRLVHALPMFHMHGLGVGINGSLTAGASMVVLPRFDADAVVDAVHAHDATLFFGVPTMYARLRDSGRLAELAHLRLLVSGSAPLDPVLFQAIAESAGQAPVERYGMSETVMLTSNPVRGERRAGSVGLPLPDVEVRLGDGGTVEVRGPNVFDGYWKRPEATAEAFTDDGWFRTGDIGESDADGYLRLVGRASDLIITGGYNVYPREVEDAILEHADVVDVAVVGVGDETWGERVVAVVVLRDGVGLDVDALDAHLDDRVAAYKRPRSWTATDALPRNAMGKVRRDVLRDQHG